MYGRFNIIKKPIAELRSVTCHVEMESHCHTTEVYALRLIPDGQVLDGRLHELTLVLVIYRKGLPSADGHPPIQVVINSIATQPGIELRLFDNVTPPSHRGGIKNIISVSNVLPFNPGPICPIQSIKHFGTESQVSRKHRLAAACCFSSAVVGCHHLGAHHDHQFASAAALRSLHLSDDSVAGAWHHLDAACPTRI